MSALDIERIILRALENHEKSLAQRERQLEEYTNLKNEQMIKAIERLYRFEKKLKLRAIELFSHVPNAKPPVLKDYIDDWDYNKTDWALDSTTYVSPPTSLKITYYSSSAILGNDNIFLCKYSPTLNIPNGRIITYIKQDDASDGFFAIYFRNQKEVGTVSYTPGYALQLDNYHGTKKLYRDGSVLNVLSETTLRTSTAWERIRVTWFSSENGLEAHLEYWDGAEWVFILSFVDPDDYYATSDINRCGIGAHSYEYPVYFDDTEIWST